MSRRNIDGFEPATKYKRVYPKTNGVTKKTIVPSSGTRLNDDATINFIFTLAHNECARFDPEPFTVLYTAKVQKSKTDTGTQFARAADLDNEYDQFYFDDSLGGQVFFTHCEVMIDGYMLPLQKVDNMQNFFSVINKSMCDHAHRTKKYGRFIERISDTTDRTHDELPAAPTPVTDSHLNVLRIYRMKVPKELRKGFDYMTFESRAKSEGKLARFGMDGNFPFEFQSNITRGLTKEMYEEGWLPPGTEIVVRLFKRNPVHSGICSSGVEDSAIWSSDKFKEKKVEIDFKAITLSYDSLILEESELLSKIKTRGVEYYQDCPIFNTKVLPSGVKYANPTFTIPEKTKAVVLFFYHQECAFPNPSLNRSIELKRRFMPDIKKIEFEVVGRPGLLNVKGLENISTESAHCSQSLSDYHSWLVKNNLYDKPFEKFAPPTGYGYDQVLIVDLSKYSWDKPEDMIVHITYSKDSAAKWYLGCFSLQQKKITWSSKNKWLAELA